MSSKTGFALNKLGYNLIPHTVGKDEKRTASSVFHETDTGNKGYLTREDLKVALAELFGYKVSKYEADQITDKYGENINQEIGINLPQFIEAVAEKMSNKDEDEEIRHTFMAFDSQCRGFLTVEDLRKAFSKVSPHISNRTIESTFRELDRDSDGRVSYKDFDFMMKYNTQDHI